MQIKRACIGDEKVLAKLAFCLWPSHSVLEMESEFRELLAREDAACFLAEDVGFAQCQLRRDYVEGTSSSPVGYLEGIYVAEAHRGEGIAGRLLQSCESWAAEMGCTEFASDCELSNLVSQSFHQKLGFTEANRIVCYTKKL
ncbi:MAG: aminoglycoside 6'-N-acetyltransferase [Faecousia sp.]